MAKPTVLCRDDAEAKSPYAQTALLPAPFWCTKRVEPAHFDWRWRERPALALLAWEACSRSADQATPHTSGVNWYDNLFFSNGYRKAIAG